MTSLREPLLHVVLYQPDIPQNTGNIARSCAAVGAKLWLIRPLGFQLDDRYLKRAGMDYWPLVDFEAVDNWETLQLRLQEAGIPQALSAPPAVPDIASPPVHRGRICWCFTKFADKLIWDAEFAPGDVLVFGSETRGLPESLRKERQEHCLKLPMRPEVRSLNLASTANTAIYEAVRQFGGQIV